MTLPEYRNTPGWQEAIALGPQLIRLAEELPATEETGLSLQLRTLMVELPATIAADQVRGDGEVRLMPVFKLLAALEIIDKVYPALDTGNARSAVDSLTEKLAGSAAGPAEPSALPAAPPVPPSFAAAPHRADISAPAAPASEPSAPPAAQFPDQSSRTGAELERVQVTPAATQSGPDEADDSVAAPAPASRGLTPEPEATAGAPGGPSSVSVTVQAETEEKGPQHDVHPDSVQ